MIDDCTATSRDHHIVKLCSHLESWLLRPPRCPPFAGSGAPPLLYNAPAHSPFLSRVNKKPITHHHQISITPRAKNDSPLSSPTRPILPIDHQRGYQHPSIPRPLIEYSAISDQPSWDSFLCNHHTLFQDSIDSSTTLSFSFRHQSKHFVPSTKSSKRGILRIRLLLKRTKSPLDFEKSITG